MQYKINNAKCHYAYYTVIPLPHRFFVHVLFPLNLQGNPFTIISLPLLKLIVCARHYSHRRISLSKDVGRDLQGVHQQLQSDSGTYIYVLGNVNVRFHLISLPSFCFLLTFFVLYISA